MASIVNDRDLLLQAATSRVVQLSTNSIVAKYSANKFTVNNGIATPSTITITYNLLGNLYGNATFSIISGISAIDTSIVGQATLAYSNMTADTCVIRISLVFFGVTYYTDCAIEGKVSIPSNVGTCTASAEYEKILLSWPKNPEADVVGYEVRATNSGWGDTAYLYHGGNTSCTVTPGALSTLKTWYVKAYDDSNLYSATATPVSYTVAAPATVTGVAYSFEASSNTNFSVVITWNASIPLFKVKTYIVRVSPPTGGFVNYPTTNPSISLPANWVGSATVNVYVTDFLNNTSVASTNVTMVKSLPNSATNITTVAVDNQILVEWDSAVKTTLPVAGYEIRNNNINWGTQDANFLWRGNANSTLLSSPVLGTNTYYINTFDTNGKYTASGTSFTYVAVAPGIVTGLVAGYTFTSTTIATIKLTWVPPAVTSFPIDKYRLVFNRPGFASETLYTSTTSWTIQADWVNTATLSVTTIDTRGLLSAASADLGIVKYMPSNVGNVTYVPSGTNIRLSWDLLDKTTLPVAGYEIRDTNTNWGTVNTNLKWRGFGSSIELPFLSSIVGTNNYYIKAYDTDGVYSETATVIPIVVTAPGTVTVPPPVFSSISLTGFTVKIDWASVSSQFDLSHYLVTITKPGPIVSNIKVTTTEYATIVDWAGTAIVSVTAVDVLQHSGTAGTNTIPKLPPLTTGVPTYSVLSKSIVLEWEDNIKTSLPVAGYEIRTTTNGWGNTGYVYRGSSSAATIIDSILGLKTYNLKAYDTANEYSTAYSTLSYTLVGPTVSSIALPEYSDTSKTGATVTLYWVGAKGSFDISDYVVTLTKPGPIVVTSRLSANSITLQADWVGDATFSVTPYDIANNMGTLRSATITKTVPSTPASYTIATSSSGITIKWIGAAINGSLPIAGYELRTPGSTPGDPSYIWNGNSSSLDINTLSLGVNTWDLWAYDTDGKYCTVPKVITYTAVPPSTPLTVSGTFSTNLNTSTCKISWVTPTTSIFGIKHYVVTFAYTSPTTTTISNTLNSNNWEVPANWTGIAIITVIAYDNLNFPSTAATFNITKLVPGAVGATTVATAGTSILIDWPDTATTSIPVIGYEVRDTDSAWGGGGYRWKGTASQLLVDIKGTTPNTITKYIRAFDADNKYSSASRAITYILSAPPAVAVETISHKFADTSLTTATITLSWDPVTPVFGLAAYELTYLNAQAVLKTELLNTTTITLPADWLNNKDFSIRVKDLLGNYSPTVVISITKLPPNPVTGLRAQVIDNNVLLYWTMPIKTSLPLSHVSIRKVDGLGIPSLIGEKTGTFTSISELSGGTYIYYITAIDTDNNASTEVSVAAVVSQPPDFIFNAEYRSTFTGPTVVLSSAVLDDTLDVKKVVLPVNLTETFAGHFTSRGWVGPEDPVGTAGQVDAGYPIYIQPGIITGYYEEVFDYGTSLASSQVTLSLGATVVSGNPTIIVSIGTSLDNVTYTTFTGITSMYATYFRYIKVRVTATQLTAGNLYRIDSLVVRLDSKQTSDSGSLDVVAGDPSGTVVNFNSEFVDVNLISLTPSLGTAGYTALYDFRDNVIVGSYSIVSNLCTVSTTAHSLIVGQKVRLYFTTGTAIPGVYTVASVVDANNFRVNITAANTSGTVSTYPNSMRIYLYTIGGTRQSGKVSWSIKGY